MTQNYENLKTEPLAAVKNNTLAHQIFGSPQEFLEVLQKDFDQIAKTNPVLFTKSDLIIYSDHGSDPKGREAARIAAEHYDDLHEMSEFEDSLKGISKGDLQLDEKMVQGQWRQELREYEIEAGLCAVLTAGGAAALAAAAVYTSVIPPLAIIPGLLAGAMATVSGIELNFMIKGPAKLKAQAELDKENLEKWTK